MRQVLGSGTAAATIALSLVTLSLSLETPSVLGERDSSLWRSFYVSPAGSDRNPGTEREPFRTLMRAQRAVREVAERMEGDIAVYLRGGTYGLEGPWTFQADDSGRNGRRVIWRAYPGERPVISGGRVIRSWRRVGTRGGHPLFAAGIGDVEARQLYVGGERRVRARGRLRGIRATSFGYLLSEGRTWSTPWDLELVFRTTWRELRARVESAEHEKLFMSDKWRSKVAFLSSCCLLALPLPSYAEGAYEFLDESGEWYLDRARETVFYIPFPNEKLEREQAILGVLPTLLDLDGTLDRPVHDITFENLVFAYTGWTWDSEGGFAPVQTNFYLEGDCRVDPAHCWAKMPASVRVRAGIRIQFKRDTFVHLGGSGLNVEYGSRDNRIYGNTFIDVSGTAIQLGDIFDHHPTDPREVVAGNAVLDNLIRDVAVEYEGGVGIWAGYVARTTIAHNELANLPYTAISLGWGWGQEDYPNYPTPTPARDNHILQNYVHDYSMVLSDAGGVYILGSQPGLLIRGNVIENQRHFGGAIYLDAGASHATVTDNLVWSSHGWPYIFKGTDHVIRNNLWDVESPMDWSLLRASAVEGNRVIASRTLAPRAIVAHAGLQPSFRYLRARSRVLWQPERQME